MKPGKEAPPSPPQSNGVSKRTIKKSKSVKELNVSSLELASSVPGHVFVVGSGDCGQLGLGTDVFEKERPGKLAYFDDLEIVHVVAGGLHTLALSKSGKVSILVNIR